MVFLSLTLIATVHADIVDRRPLPAFTATAAEDWFNSAPLRVEDLRGQVGDRCLDLRLLELLPLFPWLNALEGRFAAHRSRSSVFTVREFAHERDPAKVGAKIAEFGPSPGNAGQRLRILARPGQPLLASLLPGRQARRHPRVHVE